MLNEDVYSSGFTGYGAYFSTNLTLQWRLPLALSCLSPLLVLIGIYWLPESPRYLCWVGRNDEAWIILQRIHHDPADDTQSAARAEFVQICKQIEFDKEMSTGYIEIFRKPSWRRRALLVLFITFAGQSTGTLGITNFAVIIYEDLGMKNSMPLFMYCLYVIDAVFFNFLGTFLMDKIGRRRLFRKPRYIISDNFIFHLLMYLHSHWVPSLRMLPFGRSTPPEAVRRNHS